MDKSSIVNKLKSLQKYKIFSVLCVSLMVWSGTADGTTTTITGNDNNPVTLNGANNDNLIVTDAGHLEVPDISGFPPTQNNFAVNIQGGNNAYTALVPTIQNDGEIIFIQTIGGIRPAIVTETVIGNTAPIFINNTKDATLQSSFLIANTYYRAIEHVTNNPITLTTAGTINGDIRLENNNVANVINYNNGTINGGIQQIAAGNLLSTLNVGFGATFLNHLIDRIGTVNFTAGASDLAQTLSNYTTLTIANGASLTLSGLGTLVDTETSGASTITNNGTMTWGGGGISHLATFNNTATGTIITNNNQYPINTINNSGTITGQLKITTQNGANNTINLNGGAITGNGGLAIVMSVGFPSFINFNAANAITLGGINAGGNNTTNINANQTTHGNWTNMTNINVNSPAVFTIDNLNSVSVPGGTFTMAANATTHVSSGSILNVPTLNSSGTLNIDGNALLTTLTVNAGGTTTIADGGNLTGTTANISGSLTQAALGAGITLTNLTINPNASASIYNPIITNFTNSGTLTTNSAITKITNFTMNTNFTQNFDITGFTSFTTAVGTTFNSNNTLTGNTFTSNGIFNFNSGVITIPTFNNNGTFTLNDSDFNGTFVNGVGSNLYLNADFSTKGPLNGGNIYVNAGTLTLNYPASGFTTLQDNSIITIATGGNIFGPVTSTVANAVLNINTSFSTNANITDVGNINVNTNGTTFTVSNAVSGFQALNLAANTTLTLNTGGSLTPPAAGKVSVTGTLNLNGGTLNGTAVGLGGASTLNVQSTSSSAGPISGFNTLTIANGAAFNLSNAVSNITNFTNSGTLNLSNGASITSNVADGGGSTINVNGTFGTGALMAADQFFVNSGGTFTINNAITQANGLTVQSGGTLIQGAAINGAGPVTNNGTFTVSPTAAPLAIAGSFTNNANGVLQVGLIDTGNYSQLNVTGAANIGGTLQVLLPDNGAAITDGETFTILQSTGGLTYNPATGTSLPNTFLLNFTATKVADTIVITAERTGFNDITSDVPALNGISNFLQNETAGNPPPGVENILIALNGATSGAQITEDLKELLPSDVNDAAVAATFNMMDLSLDRMTENMMLARSGIPTYAELIHSARTGYSAGDLIGNRASYGPLFFGNLCKQKEIDGIDGFTAHTGGIGFMGDTPITRQLKLGFGFIYAGSSIKTDSITNNTTSINSLQGAVYGSWELKPFFVDGVLGVGNNSYLTKRNINFLSQTARGKYNGYQYTARGRGGILIPMGTVEVSPMTTVQYMQLYQKEYTETGAPGSNLVVGGRKASALQVGFGARVADITNPEDYYPEIHALALLDLKSSRVLVTARFVEGGPGFVTQGPEQSKVGINAGASVQALYKLGLVVNLGYDLEAKKDFFSHTVFAKIRWVY